MFSNTTQQSSPSHITDPGEERESPLINTAITPNEKRSSYLERYCTDFCSLTRDNLKGWKGEIFLSESARLKLRLKFNKKS